MSNPVQTLKGFRDILPTQQRLFQRAAASLQTTFERFGFEPIATPTLEYAELLLGKYGDEADKLVYSFEDRGGRKVALRYDQTVPTARFLVENQNNLPKQFRRYQIGPVFRADKPQKGRFREFTQCDCDIFGSTDPIADAEILAVFYQAYADLGLNSVQIEFNDRQTLLAALSPFATDQVSVNSIIQSIDKLDKQSPEAVIAELETKGLPKSAAQAVLLKIENAEKSSNLLSIEQFATDLGIPPAQLVFNPKLARGLDYYTGLIFEAKIPEYPVGSVGGGGRYDNLIGELAGMHIPAVGFGIGFDRTLEAISQLESLPLSTQSAQVMVTVFSPELANQSAQLATQLRQAKIDTELYPSFDTLGKQFKTADQKNIPFAVILGQDEVEANKATLKNLLTGEQQTLDVSDLITQLSK